MKFVKLADSWTQQGMGFNGHRVRPGDLNFNWYVDDSEIGSLQNTLRETWL